MRRSDVLIIGAGPTGLVLALWLTKLGVKVRIVDKTAEPGTTSRALAVQARTLELYRQLDLTDAVLKHGHRVPAVNLWVNGEPATRLSFECIGSDLTPYPFLHIFPQDQHERLLIERLERLGVSVGRRTELVSFTDEGERVIARLRGPEGQDEICGGELHRWLRRRPLNCARHDRHSLSWRHLPAGLLRRQCRSGWPSAQWRTARRSRRGRFPGGIPVGRERESPPHRNRAGRAR